MSSKHPFRPWPPRAVVLACSVAVTVGFLCGRSGRPNVPARALEVTADRPLAARVEMRISAREVGVARSSFVSGPGYLRGRMLQLRTTARVHGAEAMTEALLEPNLVVRGLLRNAVLQGWAADAPDAAAAWVQRLPPVERANAMAAVFSGAVEHADQAVELGKKLCRDEPDAAATYGDMLVRALDDAGAYLAALRFAQQSPEVGAKPWINTVFADWSSFEPVAAVDAIAKLADSNLREAAFAGLITGWSNANPESLANFAVRLSAGAERDNALGQALSCWALNDPAAALAWINQHPGDQACDGGLGAVATQPDLVGSRPDLAIECAASIAQPELRTSLLRMLAESWAARDRSGAAQFVARFASARADDRHALNEGLNVAAPRE